MEPRVTIGTPSWTNESFDMNAPNSSAIVVIYDYEKQDGRESERLGRPVFKTKPYIKIEFPGDNLTSIDRPLREEDKREYPQAWERYQKKEHMQIDGTPLAHWPMMTRLQVAELNALNIWSVEQLVTLPQVHAHKVMGFEMLKAKAIKFLESSKLAANAEAAEAERKRVQEEIEKRDAENKELRAQVEKQAIQLKALQDLVANMPARRKPGRPPKGQVNGSDSP